MNDEVKKEPHWERVTVGTWRLKVEGGYLYQTDDHDSNAMCFVPDVDLTRYQAHLRDAYNQGYKDGHEEGILTGRNRAIGAE